MQCIVCSSSCDERTQWPCHKCFTAIYCSKECRKVDRDNHSPICVSIKLGESLERFADKLVSIAAFKKCFTRFFGGPYFSLIFTKEELRKIEHNPVKNMPLIISRLEYVTIEEHDRSTFYIRIECGDRYTDRIVKYS